MKLNDSLLNEHQHEAVAREALRALKRAGAVGVFPTPVDDILKAVGIVEDPEDAFGDGLIKSFRRRFPRTGKFIRQAINKILGVLHVPERIIYLGKSLVESRRTFLKLHEVGHAFLPWQCSMFKAVEESDETICPEIAETFEIEANVFASEVLFQCDAFITEALDYPDQIKTPMKLAKKYGASVYSSIRQYVRKNPRPCAVLVLEPTEFGSPHGFKARVRRCEYSSIFVDQFGEAQWPEYILPEHELAASIPMNGKRMTLPRGFDLVDMRGQDHACIAEGFSTPYHTFILFFVQESLKNKIILF